MKYYDLVYFFSGEKNVKISDALVINEILINVVRFKNKSVRIILCFFSRQLGPQVSFNREFVALNNIYSIWSKVLSTTLPCMI